METEANDIRTKEDRPEPEVVRMISSATTAIDQLDVAINKLEDRLDPVLKTQGPTNEEKLQAEIPTSTKIGSILRDISRAISINQDRVRQITSRLEV